MIYGLFYKVACIKERQNGIKGNGTKHSLGTNITEVFITVQKITGSVVFGIKSQEQRSVY